LALQGHVPLDFLEFICFSVHFGTAESLTATLCCYLCKHFTIFDNRRCS